MKTRRTFVPLLLASATGGLLAGCVADEEIGKVDYALSQDGAWDIPADTLAIGDDEDVPYTGAGPWVGSSGCHGSLSAGAGLLRDWVYAAFPQVTHVGGYACRSINGDSTTMSVHATGRALDIHIPTYSGEADNDLGDPVGNYFIEHAEEIGVQYIIWDRWTWGAHRADGAKERAYGGAHPHHDHLHVELSTEGGAARTPWFSSGMPLPDAVCGSLPSDGGVVSETDDCFSNYGPAAYWRTESLGHGGSMLWTNAFENPTPSNWARWNIVLDEGGRYAVEVYAEPAFSVHHAARYMVRHAGVEHALTVDLASASGWLRLGEFDFAAGGGQHLNLYDNSSTAVPSDQHLPADAMRLVRIDPTSAPGPDPEPGPGPVTEPEPEPGPSTYEIYRPVPVEVLPLAGGDPSIDDDPMGDGRSHLAGCSAAPGRTSGGTFVLALFALGLIARRRR